VPLDEAGGRLEPKRTIPYSAISPGVAFFPSGPKADIADLVPPHSRPAGSGNILFKADIFYFSSFFILIKQGKHADNCYKCCAKTVKDGCFSQLADMVTENKRRLEA